MVSKNGHILIPKSEFNLIEGNHSSIMRASIDEEIKYNLRGIILTRRGERKLYPEIGSEVIDLIFRPLTPDLEFEIKNRIESAVKQAEPRVDVLEVDVSSQGSDRSQIQVHLKYEILENNKVEQFKMLITP